MAYYDGTSRIGQIDKAGDVDALFLKVFSGEVLTTFEENNIMLPLHRTRTISSGKTAQFPTTGVASATYHTPGESLFGDEYTAASTYLAKVAHSEVTIAIDGVLTASAFVNDIDEAKNHYEVRSIYSTEIGRQLAYHADKAIMRTIVGGARATADRFANTVSDSLQTYGGGVIQLGGATPAGLELNPDEGFAVTADLVGGSVNGAAGLVADAKGSELMLDTIFTVARLMDEKNVPADGRYCVVPPSVYYKLITGNQDAINRDYGNDSNGSIAQGNIVSVAGVRILKSNHVPTTDESASALLSHAGINNDLFGADSGYGGNCAETVGFIFQTDAVGTVKLLDLAMESEYFMERMGTLMMAKYAMGHGVLRNEACYEIVLDAA